MKRLILIAFAVVLLIPTCTLDYTSPALSPNEAWQKAAAIAYEDDPNNYWKSPKETGHDRKGDCEDIACYLMYLLGPEAETELCIVKIHGYTTYHVVVLYDGKFIEPSRYGMHWGVSAIDVVKYYSYNEAMMKCTNSGTKGIK